MSTLIAATFDAIEKTSAEKNDEKRAELRRAAL